MKNELSYTSRKFDGASLMECNHPIFREFYTKLEYYIDNAVEELEEF